MSHDVVTVLITAVGGGGHGEQIMKALRMAEPDRYRIIGADINAECPQFELTDLAFTVPPAGHPEFLDAVLHLCRVHEVRALFHGCEPELLAYSGRRKRIQDAGIFLPINPENVIQTCMDKASCAKFLSDNGFEVPRFHVLAASNDLDLIDFFPVVVKPFRGAGGSKDCFIVQSPAQLKAIATYLEIGAERQFLAQEYVGLPGEEYTVGVLHDMSGNFINSIALRRELKSQLNIRAVVPNRTARSDLGDRLVISSGVSQGRIGKFEIVTRACEKIAHRLGVKGPINIQGRLVGDTFYVFEINPRFSGTTSLRAMMGYNEPDILVRRHIFNEPVESHFAYREGMIIRSLAETVLSDEGAPNWRSASNG